MKVILTTDVKKVGQRGTVVTVADGYAQNVLLPKKLAIAATPDNIKRIESEHALAADKKAMQAIMAGKALEAINDKTITIKAKANEQGGLFQAIQEKQIADAIHKQLGVELTATQIKLESSLKKTGVFDVSISGTATVHVTIEP